MAGSPLKFPCSSAGVGCAVSEVTEDTYLYPSKLAKKNTLSRFIGPPKDPPSSLRMNGGFGRLVAK